MQSIRDKIKTLKELEKRIIDKNIEKEKAIAQYDKELHARKMDYKKFCKDKLGFDPDDIKSAANLVTLIGKVISEAKDNVGTNKN